MLGGYMGRVLRVDLNLGKVSETSIEESVLRKFIGGTGLGMKILYDEVPPGVDVFDPENRLVLTTGPLTATPVPGSCRYTCVSKAPSTGFTPGHAQSGGQFAVQLKRCGVDAIIVHGAAKKPVYLWLHGREAEIRDATGIWGKDAFETEDLVRQDVGEPKARVCCIGPAGENLCRQAAIENDKGHILSRGSMGGVMGSKKLKAIAAFGAENPSVAHRAALLETAKAWRELNRNGSFGLQIDTTGTAGWVPPFYELGLMPIKNLTTNVFDVSKLDGYYLRDTFKLSKNPYRCFNCHLNHCHLVEVTEGPYKGFVAEEPEFESIAAWATNIGVGDLGTAVKIGDLVDRLGFDALDLGFTIGMTMECYERGILTRDQLGGIDLSWGNAEGVIMLIERIARREGIGNILAEGPQRAAERIGGDAPNLVVHAKGAGIHFHDVRGAWGAALPYAVGSFAGSLEAWGADFLVDPELGYEEVLDRCDPTGKAEANKKVGAKNFLLDCLGVCMFTSMEVPGKTWITALNETTGWDMSFEEALQVGERIMQLARAFAVRHGLTPADDALSPRLLTPPKDGGATGADLSKHLAGMIQEYYQLMGWDEKTAKPLRSTLKRLGLDYVIRDLWG